MMVSYNWVTTRICFEMVKKTEIEEEETEFIFEKTGTVTIALLILLVL
jgi:hypothetical protein